MKKWIAGAILAAGIVSVGGTAFAGEIGGSGKPTPINDFRAGSICSFSGLNDDPNEAGMFNDGHVQSWGDVVKEARTLLGDGKGVSALTDVMHAEGPGTSCRGYASQD